MNIITYKESDTNGQSNKAAYGLDGTRARHARDELAASLLRARYERG